MPGLVDLPVELHALILKFLLSSEREPRTSEARERFDRGESLKDDDFRFIARDGFSKALFPFNAANTCRLWYDILIQIPHCWTRVCLDVDTDPSLFLDVFSWSKDLEITGIVVYSTEARHPSAEVDSDEELDPQECLERHERSASLEATRVNAIYNALKPHLHRCITQIIFTVRYESSLPPPVVLILDDESSPNLFEFTQTALLKNHVPAIDDPSKDTSVECCRDTTKSLSMYSGLRELTLTGYWFMYMLLHEHTVPMFKMQSAWGSGQWYPTGHQLDYFRVSDFEFEDTVEGVYTLVKFLRGLAPICARRLSLSRLSILDASFDPPNSDTKFSALLSQFRFTIQPQHMIFNELTAEFLHHFNFFAIMDAELGLTYCHCSIPSTLDYHRSATLSLENLDLKPEDDEPEEDTPPGDSLRNAVHKWMGGELRIYNCPSFDDNFIFWMHQELPNGLLPAQSMTVLRLRNCTNFSPLALRHFIEFRARHASPTALRLAAVIVDGQSPALTEDDKEWFRSSSNMKVMWSIPSNDGTSNSGIFNVDSPAFIESCLTDWDINVE